MSLACHSSPTHGELPRFLVRPRALEVTAHHFTSWVCVLRMRKKNLEANKTDATNPPHPSVSLLPTRHPPSPLFPVLQQCKERHAGASGTHHHRVAAAETVCPRCEEKGWRRIRCIKGNMKRASTTSTPPPPPVRVSSASSNLIIPARAKAT